LIFKDHDHFFQDGNAPVGFYGNIFFLIILALHIMKAGQSQFIHMDRHE